MAAVARETVMQALFTRFSGVAPFVTTARKLVLWDQVPIEQRPALFQHEIDEEYQGGERKTPRKRIWPVQLFMYFSTKNVDVPASIINPVLDAIDVIMSPDNQMTGAITFGGLVDHCWIDGKVIKITGDLDGDGIVIVPLKIMVP